MNTNETSCWEDRSVRPELMIKSYREEMDENRDWFEIARYRVSVYTVGMIPAALKQRKIVATGLTFEEARTLVDARRARASGRETIRMSWFSKVSKEAHRQWDERMEQSGNDYAIREAFYRYLGGQYSFQISRKYTYGYELETPTAPLFRSIRDLKEAMRSGVPSAIGAAFLTAVEENGEEMVALWLTAEQRGLLSGAKVA
jgi:hypothetical protein